MEEKVPMTVVVPDLSPRPTPLGPSPAPAPEPGSDGTPRLPSERRSPRGAPSSGGRRPGRRALTSSAAAPPCHSPPASPTPPPSCPCPPLGSNTGTTWGWDAGAAAGDADLTLLVSRE
ncbi:vegetative cell wall protein gp1-like [Panicum virgatum]|uniref:vegetative cell wall protein gp1-like n=1 Tax=Panicum virgatum TaxID=38727 RepID=UPI0019D5DC25|nr:vegetative cell wall protein gp1-like [Panicum virgatum]